MSGFNEPNYTQTPNELFDRCMREMGEAELRVTLAVIRKTMGYHKDRDAISYSQIQEMTGLSRTSTHDGIEKAIEHGYIERTGKGKRGVNIFRLVVKPDQSTKATSTSSPTLPVDDLTSSPTLPTKETTNTNKENKELRKRSPLKMKFPSNIRAYTSDQLATYNQQHITDMTALVLAWHGDMYTKGLTNIGIEDSKDYIEVHKEAIRLNIPITDYPALAKYTKKKEQWLTDKGSKIPIRLMLKYVTDYKPAPKKILYDDPSMDLSKPMPNILSKFQQDELERKARENG